MRSDPTRLYEAVRSHLWECDISYHANLDGTWVLQPVGLEELIARYVHTGDGDGIDSQSLRTALPRMWDGRN